MHPRARRIYNPEVATGDSEKRKGGAHSDWRHPRETEGVPNTSRQRFTTTAGKPKHWNEIKNGKFMIINGQHSITASKELQISGCGKKRRIELSKWQAYIVYSLDPLQLTNISRFYNSTNHLEHAQPTWGWQLVSCRKIWISQGRPTDKDREHERHGNLATLSISKYNVS